MPAHASGGHSCHRPGYGGAPYPLLAPELCPVRGFAVLSQVVSLPRCGWRGSASRLCRYQPLLSNQEHQVGSDVAGQAFRSWRSCTNLPTVRDPYRVIKGRGTLRTRIEHRRKHSRIIRPCRPENVKHDKSRRRNPVSGRLRGRAAGSSGARSRRARAWPAAGPWRRPRDPRRGPASGSGHSPCSRQP